MTFSLTDPQNPEKTPENLIPALTEEAFFSLAEAFFRILEVRLEEANIDYDRTGDGVAILGLNKKQLLLTQHRIRRQMWLASPISGGLHFSYDGAQWKTASGLELRDCLSTEMLQITGIACALV